MELKEAIRTRHSVRDYLNEPVPEEKLLKVLDAARLAPSASNRQRWKFVVVRDAKTREELARAAAGQSHVRRAPVIIAAVATIGRFAAVAYVGRREFRGFGAWVLWLGVHIFNLIGFRNRILVMVDWAWDFLLYERAVRLILPSESCQNVHRRTSGELEQTPEYSRSLH